MATQTTRRALIGGAGLAGVALVAPAIAAATTRTIPSAAAVHHAPTEFARLHARSNAARARFNALPEDLEFTDPPRFSREEILMHEATDAFDHAAPTNLSELVIAMENLIGGGSHSGRELIAELIGHARRLAGGAA